jgi:hypothetical protein
MIMAVSLCFTISCVCAGMSEAIPVKEGYQDHGTGMDVNQRNQIPEAGQGMQTFVKGRNLRDSSADILRKFWKPDGRRADKSNDQKLSKWMRDNGIDTQPGSIAMFLYSEKQKDARVKAVEELHLINNP